MSGQGWFQILLFVAVVVALAYPLGIWMARVYGGFRAPKPLAWLERGFYKLVNTDPEREQDWKGYAVSVLVLTIVSGAVLYTLQRLQGHLPLNPDHEKAVQPHIAFNTTASFLTNTNFQFYGGETTMSYLTQMAGLAVQNFFSPAVALAVLAALIRGLSRRTTKDIGNFWVDFYRSIAYILVPIAIVFAVFLISQGVPQTFHAHAAVTTLQGGQQSIARGPVASQEAIKMIGTNGGGYYNSNSAVPFENPTGLTNFLEMVAILLIPMAEVFMFGRMVLQRRHALAVFAAMFAMLAVGVGVIEGAEHHSSSVLRASGVNLAQTSSSSGGNMADKEVRFGVTNSALWSGLATATGNGGADAGYEALTPAGGGTALVNIFAGEVIFGGVGSGLYGMIFYIIIAVFIAGLMVGRTPEYLGKKIEAREIKYAAVGALFCPTMAVTLAAIAVVTKSNLKAIFDPGAHGFTEALYAWTSEAFNNGSAFGGYTVNNFLAEAGGAAMLVGRYVPILTALAIGGSLAAKKSAPVSAGTFRTDGATFSVLLVGVIVLTAGLMILPALFLGPIVEGLMH
jgi:K+-transporting ATPase ATPase A chain